MLHLEDNTTTVQHVDETNSIESNERKNSIQSPNKMLPSGVKNVRFSNVESMDIVKVQNNYIGPTEEDTDDEDSMINSSSDDSILRTRATCFLSSLVPHFWPCSKSIRDDYEDDISLEDITSYLHPGAHEYVDEDLEELNASILQKTQSLYILQDKTSTPDKLFTGVLIASTAIAILVLFIYQNFGSGNLGKRHQ